MKTFEGELWQCPDCETGFNVADVKDWKCPDCDDPLWIMAVVDGNHHVLERVKAKDIKKDDVILLDDDSYGIDVKKVKRFGKKVRIYFKGDGILNENPGAFLNTIIGTWQPSDES